MFKNRSRSKGAPRVSRGRSLPRAAKRLYGEASLRDGREALLRGFTLIELLVVIAIIGLLATLSVIALSNARAKSRDSKRLADIKQMQTSLALYYDQTDHYPTTDEFNSGTISYYSAGIGTTTYMKILPAAPVPNDGPCSASGNGYIYTPTDGGASYTISFCIGSGSNNLAGGSKCATPGGILNIGCDGSGGNGGSSAGDSFSCPGIPVVQYEGGPYDADGLSKTAGGYYRTVQIGVQCWLRDNLNVGTMIAGVTAQTDNSVIEKYCYDDNAANCATDGGLYQWDEAMQYSTAAGTQGICPTGWHLPIHDDWTVLERAVCTSGTCATDFPYDITTIDWCGNSNEGSKLSLFTSDGTNSSGFTALLAGSRRATFGSFSYQLSYAYFWSSSVSGASAWYRRLGSGDATVDRNAGSRAGGFSVRCLKD